MIIITVISSTCKLVLGLVVNIAAETVCLDSCLALLPFIRLAQRCVTDANEPLLVHMLEYCENFNILTINMQFEIKGCMIYCQPLE